MEGINWASKRLRKTSLHPRKDHAGQFTSKPVIPNQSYLEIPRSDEETILVVLGSLFKGYKFIFHEDFQIPTFTRSKWAVHRNTKKKKKKLGSLVDHW
jgi:hypothetical protein